MSDTKQADGDAPDVWSSEDAPGGYVCSVCRTPTESEPCVEHQPARYAAIDGDDFGHYGDGRGVELARGYLARHSPSAHDMGLRGGVDDSCVHGRSLWSCPMCDARQLAELVSLWGRDRAAAASCRRSVRMVWPELAERLDDLLDQQDGGDRE